MVFALFAALCAVYVIACTMPREGIIINNTYVNHVNVSGLTEEEAARLIQEDFEKSYAYQSLTVEAADHRYTVMINKSLDYDAEAAAREACAFAHGFFLTRGYGVIKAAIFKQRFSRNAYIDDEEALRQAVRDSGLTDIDTTTQTTYSIEGEKLIFRKGAVGESVDEPALIQKLKEAVQKEDYVSVIKSPMLKGTVEETDMDEVYRQLHTVKQNATLDPGHDYSIVPSVDGVDYDVTKAGEIFDAAKEGEEAVVPVRIDYADVTTEDLESHLFKDTLGESVTDLSGGQNRITNIELAADSINGTILLAGESFSFNERTGERTRDKGYQSASAYPDGRGEAEVGGGVSQAASGLYESAILSDLRIDERQCHEYAPGYTEKGLDANVSWDGPDLAFTNNTPYPIRIDAACADGRLNVKLTGGKNHDNHVRIKTKILNETGHGTRYVKDRSLARGRNVVIASGENGYEIQTYREIYDQNEELISSKKEAYSKYKSRAKVIAEGTKKKKKKKHPKSDKTPDKKKHSNQRTIE